MFEQIEIVYELKGGPELGNWMHAGRIGLRGGSAPFDPGGGGEAGAHRTAIDNVMSALGKAGLKVGLSEKQVDVTVMERETYDDFG